MFFLATPKHMVVVHKDGSVEQTFVVSSSERSFVVRGAHGRLRTIMRSAVMV